MPVTGNQKMQQVSFRNLDEFLHFIPEDELKITLLLRKLIFSCLPHVTEKLAYNVPYYKLNRNICFIWPASVLWGRKASYEGVRMGFTHGHLLTDENQYLEKGSRKQVYWKDYKTTAEIDTDLLRSFIFESAAIDAQLKK